MTLLGIALVSIAGLALLGYFYTRLKRAKTALEEQYLIEQENEELTQSLTKQKILQGEVHHRVKNNLQVIIGLLELQTQELADPHARACLEAMSGRIFSMAAVHETLYQDGRGGEIDFELYTRKICQHFSQLYSLPNGCEFYIEIKDYWFNLETAIPLGTVLNELLTNSFKYGVPQDGPLRISIDMVKIDDEICLTYHDNGPGFPEGALAEREGGLGTYLLNGMSRQLRGRMESLNDEGALTRVYFKRKNQSALPKRNKKRMKRKRVANGTV
nr:sensor histidine kinase [Lewinella sp. JB7]